jgi:hypothetical protein
MYLYLLLPGKEILLRLVTEHFDRRTDKGDFMMLLVMSKCTDEII